MKRAELPGLLKNAFLVVTLFNRQRVWCEKNVFSIKLTFTETRPLQKKPFEYPLSSCLWQKSHAPLLSGSSAGCWLSTFLIKNVLSQRSSDKLVPRVPLPSAKPAGSCRERRPAGILSVSLPVDSRSPYQITIDISYYVSVLGIPW